MNVCELEKKVAMQYGTCAEHFMVDMGTLTEYVLALGDKINSMK